MTGNVWLVLSTCIVCVTSSKPCFKLINSSVNRTVLGKNSRENEVLISDNNVIRKVLVKFQHNRTNNITGIIRHNNTKGRARFHNARLFIPEERKYEQKFSNTSSNNDIVDFLLPLHEITKVNVKWADYATTLSLSIKGQSAFSRNIKTDMSNFMSSFSKSSMFPYILMPALIISAILPWILPGLKMAAGFVQMINQIAFIAGLVSLIRGFIFEQKPNEHVIYINNGYHKHKHSKRYMYNPSKFH